MKLSVITVNYNNAEGLEKTILSVLDQTFSDFEFIVIDGNSTDGSIDIIQKYTDKISYWISEPDSGIYNAMNKGIKKAKGEFLYFLNSGDYLVVPTVFEQIFKDKIYYTPIIRGNQITDFGTYTQTWINFGNREITLYDMYCSSFHHQATFFNAALFEKYGLYNETYKIVSDWEFSVKIILGGEKSTYINTDIVVYQYGGISSNEQGLINREIERDTVIKALFPSCIIEDYERLSEYISPSKIKENTFEENIAAFIMKNKFPKFIFRVISKIYRILRIN